MLADFPGFVPTEQPRITLAQTVDRNLTGAAFLPGQAGVSIHHHTLPAIAEAWFDGVCEAGQDKKRPEDEQ